ncbi:hypothetical protein DER72_10117 [Halomonas sp. A11-A]|jgi:hypothetical protein|nr:hypothetical protein DER72_10117 [Halomonas sp. A11-A]
MVMRVHVTRGHVEHDPAIRVEAYRPPQRG